MCIGDMTAKPARVECEPTCLHSFLPCALQILIICPRHSIAFSFKNHNEILFDFPASLFGAMLDQLTDRCATACLLVTLAMFYPEQALWFQMSTALDIASHWLHLHRSVFIYAWWCLSILCYISTILFVFCTVYCQC